MPVIRISVFILGVLIFLRGMGLVHEKEMLDFGPNLKSLLSYMLGWEGALVIVGVLLAFLVWTNLLPRWDKE